jgi:hypothetical protein
MLRPDAPRLKMPVEEALDLSEKGFRYITDPNYRHEENEDGELDEERDED